MATKIERAERDGRHRILKGASPCRLEASDRAPARDGLFSTSSSSDPSGTIRVRSF